MCVCVCVCVRTYSRVNQFEQFTKMNQAYLPIFLSLFSFFVGLGKYTSCIFISYFYIVYTLCLHIICNKTVINYCVFVCVSLHNSFQSVDGFS